MGIEVKMVDDELSAIVVDEEYFRAEDERVIIPIPVLRKHMIKDFPKNCLVEICESIDDRAVICHNVPTTFVIMDNGSIKVVFDELTTRKYWDGVVGLKLLMETKRDVIQERSKEVGDVFLENYDDDGAYISLNYSYKTDVDTFEELFLLIDQVYNEIDGAVDLVLGSPFQKLESCAKESEFTTKILIPLFRALGFSNVKYNHGNKEYGKDITFSRKTEFDEYEYYGCQVKYGDISGSAAGEVNELIVQGKDAFQMPFYDVYTRQKVRISKLIIAISGKYTSNAVDKIVEGLTDYPMKNNVIFLDGEKIETLMARYRKF